MHQNADHRVAELVSDEVVLRSVQDILDLIGDLGSQYIDELILREANINSDFFQLGSGLAGDVLQKCSNYGLRLAIVGDFARYTSESLQAFIRESNRGNLVFFVDTVEGALTALQRRNG